MQYRIIDDNGLFVEDVVIDEIPMDANGNPDKHYISSPCPEGFYLPKWDGEKWVEGGTKPEPTVQPPSDADRITAIENALITLMGGVL